MDNNDFKVRFVPVLKKEDKQLKAKDIKAAILNDIAMLDDNDYAIITHTRLVKLNKAITEVLKDKEYKDVIGEAQQKVAELQKTNKVTVEGAELSYGATYTKYDFSVCKHPVYNFIVDVEKRFSDIRKEIETELKAIPKPTQEITGTDFETGEVETTEVGGSKRIILETEDIVARLNFVINKAEVLLQTIEDNNSIFTVYPPEKIQTFGVKVTKS